VKKILSAVLILAAIAGSAAAGEAEDAGKKLVADLSGAESQLLGKTYLGFYYGTKRIGQVVVTVEKTSEGGAAYKQTAEMEIQFGPNGSKNKQISLHDANLGLVSSTEVESDTKEGVEKKKTTTITRENGEYVRTVTKEGGEPTVQRFKTDKVCYDEALIMVAMVAAKKPGKYAFEGIKWPVTAEEKPVFRKLSLAVSAAADFKHRGNSVKASKVVGSKAGEEGGSISFQMSAEGKVLEMAPEDAPIKMVAGTMEEIGKDLPKTETTEGTGETIEGGGGGDPMDPVKVYFKVLSGQLPIDDLDKSFDWTAIHAEAAKANPQVGSMDAASFGQLVKDQIKGSIPVIPAEQVEMILGQLSAKTNGDDATVGLPGGKTMTLKKLAAGWRIVALPK
jgi:hypothetical protein